MEENIQLLADITSKYGQIPKWVNPVELYPDWFIMREGYYELKFPQGSQEWKIVRFLLVTATLISKLLNKPYCYGNSEEVLGCLRLKTRKIVNSPVAMRGIELEPVLRDYYIATYKFKVWEVSLGIPFFDTRLGGSPDALVEDVTCEWGPDGMVEFKTSDDLYYPILQYLKNPQKILKHLHEQSSDDYSHIKVLHFDQMQTDMKIFHRQWCDYMLYGVLSKRIFIQRIPFLQQYWDTEYVKVKEVLELL